MKRSQKYRWDGAYKLCTNEQNEKAVMQAELDQISWNRVGVASSCYEHVSYLLCFSEVVSLAVWPLLSVVIFDTNVRSWLGYSLWLFTPRHQITINCVRNQCDSWSPVTIVPVKVIIYGFECATQLGFW